MATTLFASLPTREPGKKGTTNEHKEDSEEDVGHRITFDSYGRLNLDTPEPKHTWATGWGEERAYIGEDVLTYHIPPRTSWSHPYSFDPETLFDTGEKHVDAAWHDRMQQWDYTKFNDCLKRAGDVSGELHFRWNDRSQVTKLMRLYNNDPKLTVTKVTKTVNMSSGYPIWIIYYIPGPKKPTKVTKQS